ncbi:hypothetical protein BC832DRAFT_589137 [Gaertneriomyces semiglobifer]|nr:hypothetical protein BC832DRAFT_589137 [Gaertneriomyces semiglobifer]
MDFTELYKQSATLCRFSPNGQYLATAVQFRLVIRDADSLEILQLFTCTDIIQDVSWSPDSELILCASYKLGHIQVWSMKDEAWTAKISEGLGGLTNVQWAPDARHIMSFSDFQLRLTIWSLVTKEARYLQYPKYTNKGYCFRKDGRYFLLTERKDCKDYLSIYDCEDWTLLKRFQVETNDLEDVAWSPDGRFIAVWEPNLEYKVLIYHPDGRLAKSYSAYDQGLGIKSVTWSPSSQFLAIGSYDQKVRLLNYYTWQPLIDFSHPKELSPTDIPVFREIDVTQDVATGIASWAQAAQPHVRYEVLNPPLTIPQIKPEPDKPNPKLGVGLCEFNADGRLLVTRNDNMPHCLWVWDIISLRQLALLQQAHPIRCVKWNPLQPHRLAFCCGNGRVYLWEGGETNACEAIEVPAANFQIMSMEWNPDGKSLIMMDKDKFCIGFPVDAA